jgi:hypothetical protein
MSPPSNTLCTHLTVAFFSREKGGNTSIMSIEKCQRTIVRQVPSQWENIIKPHTPDTTTEEAQSQTSDRGMCKVCSTEEVNISPERTCSLVFSACLS